MIPLYGTRPPASREAAARVKGWVIELLGLPVDAAVLVTELRCAEDDCPDVETVIAVFGEPGQARKHKLPKPVADVTRDDVRSLAARGTHG